MSEELIRAAEKARNGHHGLMDRTARRGVRVTFYAEPAAPMVVCVLGESPIPSDEFETFTIPADQPDLAICREFKHEIAKYADSMPHATTR